MPRKWGATKNSVKFPLAPCSIVYGGAWRKPEFFHDRRRHTLKTQVVSAEAVDMSDLVWRQPREDCWRDGIALIDSCLHHPGHRDHIVKDD